MIRKLAPPITAHLYHPGGRVAHLWVDRAASIFFPLLTQWSFKGLWVVKPAATTRPVTATLTLFTCSCAKHANRHEIYSLVLYIYVNLPCHTLLFFPPSYVWHEKSCFLLAVLFAGRVVCWLCCLLYLIRRTKYMNMHSYQVPGTFYTDR